jgi:hypothetical protein
MAEASNTAALAAAGSEIIWRKNAAPRLIAEAAALDRRPLLLTSL